MQFLLYFDDPHGVGESGAGLPSGDDDDEAARFQELTLLADGDGKLNPGVHVIRPRGDDGLSEEQREAAPPEMALSGSLFESGDSQDGGTRAVAGHKRG